MLSDKQQRFVSEYLVDLNAKQAAIRSGYSSNGAEVQGHRLLSNANVRAAINEVQAETAKKLEVTKEYVLGSIVETIERCRQSAPVLDRKGEMVMAELPTGEVAPAYEFDSRGVLKGAELLGKHLGMFTEKVEHTGKDGGPIEVVSDREAARRIAFMLTKGSAKAE